MKANGGDFLARSIAGVTGALERAVYSEEMARLPGLLQRVDPRAKLIATLLLLLSVGLAHHLSVVLSLYLATLLMAGFSRQPIIAFSKRVWLGIPLFAGFVVLPSLFTLPGQSILTLMDEPPIRIAVTDNGLSSASLVVARVGTSVSLALLLVTTTRWTELLTSLRVLFLPESFLVVLAMTHRYLFLFLRTANNLFLARASRTAGSTPAAEQRRWAAAATGTLLSRSVKLSADVLLAMQARGFEGEIRCSKLPSLSDGDRMLVALAVVISAGALLVDRSLM